MKIKAPLLLLAVALLAAGAAPAKTIVRVPPPEGVLPVIITESLGHMGNAYTDFDRLDMGFRAVAKERHWPVKIAAEKVAANVPDYLTELRISIQRVRQEVPGEYVYRGWTTLWVSGKKHDFGIVSYSYYYRMGENMDDVMNKVFLGAAKVTADKIEPLLFPDLNPKKK